MHHGYPSTLCLTRAGANIVQLLIHPIHDLDGQCLIKLLAGSEPCPWMNNVGVFASKRIWLVKE